MQQNGQDKQPQKIFPKAVIYRIAMSVWLWGFLSVISHAQSSTLKAHRIQSDIQLDGKLEETEWREAQKIHSFIQRDPYQGLPVSEKTAVAVLYNHEALFIGAWCFDRQVDKIVAREMRRDFQYEEEDNFIITLDTYYDKRNGYRFAINPNGAKADALILENGLQINIDWNGVWYVSTNRTSKGWFLEIEIPFSTLKFSEDSLQTWGINFGRNIRRIPEESSWQGWYREARLEEVSRAGELTGLGNLPRTTNIEIKPYLTGSLEKITRLGSTTFSPENGIDVNFRSGPAIKFNITYNPDFAQAEVDQSEINLTRFPITFPEKREFFLDGANYFNTEMGKRIFPFYSRRIGLSDNRNEVPILGGIRVLAKQKNATLGATLLQTSQYQETPATTFWVLRWKRDIGKQSYIGFISPNKLQDRYYNGSYGTDFLYSTSKFLGNKNLFLGGAYLFSYTSNKTLKMGNSRRLFMTQKGDLLEFYAEWEKVDHHFNPEVGFLKRKNYEFYRFSWEIEPRLSIFPKVRKFKFKPITIDYFINDSTRAIESLLLEHRPLGWLSESGEIFRFNIQRRVENLQNNFKIHQGIIIPVGEYWFTRYRVSLESSPGRPVFISSITLWGVFYNGKRLESSLNLTIKTSAHLKFSMNYRLNQVKFPQGSFKVHELSTRIDFAISPKFFGAAFAQWNNNNHLLLLNFRTNWIPRPGTNFFLILNPSFHTRDNMLKFNRVTMLTKFVWRFIL